jgi:hypothetical protein
MEHIEKHSIELGYDETKNRYTVSCNVTHVPVDVVEELINMFYKSAYKGEFYETFDLFMKELKLARLISKLGWIVAIVVTILAALKMRGVL